MSKYCHFYCSDSKHRQQINVSLNGDESPLSEGISFDIELLVFPESAFSLPDFLIIEDEVKNVADILKRIDTDQFGFKTIGVILDSQTLQKAMKEPLDNAPKLITLDFHIGGRERPDDGKQAEANYDLLKSKFHDVPIIGITNYSKSDFVEELINKMRRNYDNVWPKSMIYGVLPSLIEDRLAIQKLSNQVEELTEELKTTKDQRDINFVNYYFNKLPIKLKDVNNVTINGKNPEQILADLNLGGGQSIATKCMFYQIAESIKSEVFLISGESGAGKDIISKIIHKYSNKKGEHKKFNCAELSGADPNIAAQKLFGTEKGEFQGVATSKGWLETASPDGTVFLDEIHHMPLEVQAKFLDVIRNKTFHSAGGSKEKKLVNVKLVFATNRDLKEESQSVPPGIYHDFYNRIHQTIIKVPSLAERKDEFTSITKNLIEKLNKRHRTTKEITKEAIEKLKSFSYENANIEKLHTILQNAVTLCKADMITPEWIVDGDDKSTASGGSDFTFDQQSIDQHLNRLKKWIPTLKKIKKDVIGQQELAAELNIKQTMISQDLGSRRNDNENKIMEIINQQLLLQDEVEMLLKLKSFKTKFIELCKQHYTLNTD